MTNSSIIRDSSTDWLEIASLDGGELFVFSPFITGESVKDILAAKRDKTFFVFTSLRMNSVLSGSLDLKVLQHLIENGASGEKRLPFSDLG